MMSTIVTTLLASDEPSVRYKVLVNVLGTDPQSAEIRQLEEQISSSPRVRRLLSEQDKASLIADERCQDALDLLESKRLPDGGWPAEKKYYRVTDKPISGRSRVDWGGASKKRMNEFVTADVLSVLKAARRLPQSLEEVLNCRADCRGVAGCQRVACDVRCDHGAGTLWQAQPLVSRTNLGYNWYHISDLTERCKMASPFPGMDPYLEAPDIWPDFHDRLATVISVDLNNTLPEPYYARLQMRPELGVVLGEGIPRRIVPDVVVVRWPEEAGPTTAVLDRPRTEISEAVHVTVRTDPIRHHFVEIRDAVRGHKLVTLIEIVSPSNKSAGPDRQAYKDKQREVLRSDASLIELDLLRGGDRILPYADLYEVVEHLNPDYLILINRATGRQGMVTDYELYPVALGEQLPCIPVPLRAGEPDVPLDLQVMVNRAYDGGPYRRMIDYTHPPDPPLSDEDATWADRLLHDAGRR